VIGFKIFTTLKAVTFNHGKRLENISNHLLFIIEQVEFGKKGSLGIKIRLLSEISFKGKLVVGIQIQKWLMSKNLPHL